MQKATKSIPDAITQMRIKHGFHNFGRASLWSKRIINSGHTNDIQLPPQSPDWPKNQLLFNELEQKFFWAGFHCKQESGMVATGKHKQGKRFARWITFENYPMIGGYAPTLTDLYLLPVELFDGYRRRQITQQQTIGQKANLNGTLVTMNATGLGYKGLCGVSWLPSLEPIFLTANLEQQLVLMGDAIFLLYDAVAYLYKENDEAVVTLLSYKVPQRIAKLALKGSVDIIRPDIVVSTNEDGAHRLVITELESCPAGQGMTHAMQIGYNLSPAMADNFAQYLGGRDFIVLATHQWSEYIFEQAVFVKALRQRGVNAFIVIDHDLQSTHHLAQANWKAPKELPLHLANSWDTDFLGRIKKHKFDCFIFGNQFPENLGSDVVIYRFGYFDNFTDNWLNVMQQFQERGATIINPLQYFLESKSLMAAAKLPSVRRWISAINPAAIGILDSCLAETRLLHHQFTPIEELAGDRHYWLTKYAAWDGNNKSWGSRSLEFGSQHSENSWIENLERMSRLPHPVVAQHVIAPAEFQVTYADYAGTIQEFTRGRSRLTPFLIRGKHGAVHCGSTITLRENTVRIHGASDAVEGPVIFRD